MSDVSTFVKLDRNILEWGWYTEPITKVVFIHLLLKANIKDHEYMGVMVKRGDVIASFKSIADANGISVQQARTAISHLESTREVTHRGYAKFSLFTVENYDKYQARATQSATYNQQTANKQLTSNQQHLKNDKNNKERKEYIGASEIREWEKRLNVPEDLLGRFATEEEFKQFWE